MTILEIPPFDLAVTDRLLATTRSVRKRLDLDRTVESRVIMECLDLAVQAPTASGVQRWRWLVVTDPEKRAALADLYREGNVEFQKMMAGRGAHESTAFDGARRGPSPCMRRSCRPRGASCWRCAPGVWGRSGPRCT